MSGNTRPTQPWTLFGMRFREIREQHTAFVRAMAAGFHAVPAAFRRVLRVLLGAGFTNLGADLPDHIDHFTVTRHVSRGQAADLCAIHTQPDAARQLGRI